MKELMKRGVELADGFWVSGNGIYLHGEANMTNWLCPLANPRRYVVDAIAAQLVRQVDATQWKVHIYRDGTFISRGPDYAAIVKNGEDRSLRTIEAVIEWYNYVNEEQVSA